MKVFISVGMSGRNEEDVRKDIARVTDKLYSMFEKCGDNIEIVHNYDIKGPENAGRLWYLGNAIIKMDNCDAIAFTEDYYKYRGCLVEEEVAKSYKIKRIYEKASIII